MDLDGLVYPADCGSDMIRSLRNGDLLVAGKMWPLLVWFCNKTEQTTKGWDDASMIARVRAGKPLVVVLYNHYHRPDIWMHVASEDRTIWCTPDFLFHVFYYPFVELRCNRVTGILGAKKPKHHRFVKHLGFQEEGRLREALPTGDDFIVYGMLRRECRWIGEQNEQAKFTTNA